MVFGAWLMGCASVIPATSSVISSHQTEAAMNLGQTLPISAQTTIAGHLVELEVARTSQQQATGLMYRTTLAADRGMLFPFSPPQPVSFWMENTLIPLDIVFLRGGVVKAIAANTPPCNTNPCPTYGPRTPIDQVIELRGGRAAHLGLKVGDRLKIQFFAPKPSHL